MSRTRFHHAPIVAAALLGLSLAACDHSPAPLSPDAAVFAHGIDKPRTAEFNRQLAALRRATAPFHNFEKAEHAGYGVRITSCWYHRELGAQGYHYGNPDLIDGTVDLLEPELLMYEPQKNGRLRLVGVEYIVPIAAWEGEDPPTLLGQEFHRNEALGLFALHVWLWRHNPAGMFADWNPKVSCEFADEAEDRAP
ncbi:MAG: hypothetical protein ACR2H9_01810 [Longimicrobiaceae bacterium]|jgi:hypothetical protein